MSTTQLVETCLNEPYPVALERYGVSYTIYIAIRREHRFPSKCNLGRRNMDFRRRVIEVVCLHPEWAYRDVACYLSSPLPAVWKVFTDYMLHDASVRFRVSKMHVQVV